MKRRSRGFTSLEFIVVIGIIFLLLTLLVPAIQNSQRVAKAVQCRNNLKQIALALHNYHDAQQTFPPGYISIMGLRGSTLRNEWAWGAFMLPYLEQTPLFQAVDFNTSPVPINSDENAGGLAPPVPPMNGTTIATMISVFSCPSDTMDTGGWRANRSTQKSTFAHSSYAAVSGIHWMRLPCATLTEKSSTPMQELTASPCLSNDGAFYLNSHVRIEDFHDGLSSTLVFGETSLRLDQPRGATPDFSSNKIEFSGGSNWAGVSHPYAQDEVLTATIDGIDEPVRGGFSAGLNSFHDDGVVVAFGDGSVRLLSRKMDSKRESPFGVLQRLSTIQSGDVIEEF